MSASASPGNECPECHQSHVGLSPRDIGAIHDAAINWYDDSGRNGVLNNVEHSRWGGGKAFPNEAARLEFERTHPEQPYDLAVKTLGAFVKEYNYDRFHEVYLDKFEHGALVHYVPTGFVFYYPESQMDAAFDFAKARGRHSRSLNTLFGQ